MLAKCSPEIDDSFSLDWIGKLQLPALKAYALEIGAEKSQSNAVFATAFAGYLPSIADPLVRDGYCWNIVCNKIATDECRLQAFDAISTDQARAQMLFEKTTGNRLVLDAIYPRMLDRIQNDEQRSSQPPLPAHANIDVSPANASAAVTTGKDADFECRR